MKNTYLCPHCATVLNPSVKILLVDKETDAKRRRWLQDQLDDVRWRRERDDEPYGRLSEIVNGHAFTAHPYKHPTIGTMTGLEAVSLDEVRAFYRTFYVPANATVVIAGDVDPGRAVELMSAAVEYYRDSGDPAAEERARYVDALRRRIGR